MFLNIKLLTVILFDYFPLYDSIARFFQITSILFNVFIDKKNIVCIVKIYQKNNI